MRFSLLNSKHWRVGRQTWRGAVRLSFWLIRLESSGCWLEEGKKQNRTLLALTSVLGEGERNLPDLVLTPWNCDFIIPKPILPLLFAHIRSSVRWIKCNVCKCSSFLNQIFLQVWLQNELIYVGLIGVACLDCGVSEVQCIEWARIYDAIRIHPSSSYPPSPDSGSS